MAQRRPESGLPRTLAEFGRWHAQQPERWEFIAGVPVLMAPASLGHTIIKGNVYHHLANRLAGSPCRAFVDGAEIKSRQFSAIPNVVVSGGPIDLRSAVIAEPVLIVEVLSPSSERDDIGRKWQGYCLIPALRHYLVIAQDQPFVTLHTRIGPAAFEESVHQEGSIELAALGVTLALDEIYEDVTFEQPDHD